MATYYDKQKTHNTAKLRNWTIYASSAANRDLYNIYYIDSEWRTAASGSGETASLTKLATAFGDGVSWTVSSSDDDSNGTFTCIIVRLSDRKVVKCVAVADDDRIANNSIWTCTDITGDAWYEELRKLRLLGNI